MELTLLRHAPLAKHLQKRYIGHSNRTLDTTLFEIEKVAPLLEKKYDAIYTSDLLRCTQTLQQCGLNDFIPDKRLREVRFKPKFEGKSFGEIEQMEEFDPLFLESQERWHTFICDESPSQFHERLHHFLEELPKEGSVLCCTHAGVIREILTLLTPQNSPKILDYLDYVIVTVK